MIGCFSSFCVVNQTLVLRLPNGLSRTLLKGPFLKTQHNSQKVQQLLSRKVYMSNSENLKEESVWDYPRPPRLERTRQRLRVVHRGKVIADTQDGYRILETSHPPTYYFPPESVNRSLFRESNLKTFCEFKGTAIYYDIHVKQVVIRNGAWCYPETEGLYKPISGYFSFYGSKFDEAYVGNEKIIPQEGDFYGGWITKNLKGPFKGAPGTRFW
ncbi:uncharacterized protein Gasu_57280 [Galdieria sulphuraria]|uniref:DUF427 domain-containing protein n=1 Tax=Galdieria sulphuraria TaxID=130081 RepID=M2XT37_GALSU|nr:uncharacterized protein Gasu_57280 [Galdieria sulphuraria]EME26604.1 hypothetical protein Gasu_57280 [Galdieria sulphuraria]|eukprot:XP_005703124.1 hypothetical protein Gasu_57280 [Galdieria sulphuraria]